MQSETNDTNKGDQLATVKDRSFTSAGSNLATSEEYLVPLEALDRGNEALAALQVLDMFRSLSPAESERVYSEVQRARIRMASPQAEAAYLVLEDFRVTMEADQGKDSEEFILSSGGLTLSELRAYRRAWKTLEKIHKAAVTRAIEEAREAGELPPA